MKRNQGFLFPVLLIACFGWGVQAQNLVMNPSFENYFSCPSGISNFSLAVNWQNPYGNIPGDTCSTPDLYNRCGFGVPQNILGNQDAKTGNGYAGMILYDGFPFTITGCNNLPTGWREYLEGTLTSPLVAGQVYCVAFYLSLADNVKFATDDIGVYFSNSSVNISCTTVGSSSVLPFTPQLQYNGSALSDTSKWTKLDWSYTAVGGERYFIIGNFKNDANTTYTCVNPNAINSHAYYYIDDVEVTQDVCCPDINVISISGVSCSGGNDGSATVQATGGVAPYTYHWSGGGGNNATTLNRAAGNYTVSVSDARGCLVTEKVTITQPDPLTVSISSFNTSCGNSASATPQGGTAPFTYSWSTGSTGASVANLPAGTYYVTVSDGGGCTVSNSVNLTQAGGFGVSTSTTSSSCSLCTGEATAAVSGGVPPYSYTWSDGQTIAVASGLCPGSYTVTVTESSSGGGNVFWNEDFTNGGAGWTLNLLGPNANGATANEWVINNDASCAVCPGPVSGGNSLHITCTGLIPCQFSGDDGTCTYNTGPGFIFQSATDKYVTSPNISTIGKTGITLTFWYAVDGEAGADYGLVRLSNNGGTTWTDLPAQYSGTPACAQATVSIPAAYENIPDFRIGFRWINDDNGDGNDPPFMVDDIELSAAGGSSSCTAVVPVVVNSVSGPSVTLAGQTDVTCHGDSNGVLAINVSGGTTPYTFNWSTGASTEDLSGLSGGMYSITVSDINNCSATFSASVAEPLSISLSASVTDAGCGSPGSIILTPGGGTVPYNYLWTGGATTQNLSNIQAGTYAVTLTDANGCVDSSIYIVNSLNNAPVLSLTSTDALCEGIANGSVSSSITGGVSPYQYSWSNGATTVNLSAVPGGTYTLTITDNDNCTVSESAVVSEPNAILTYASITRVLCDFDSIGGIKLGVAGGTSPYQIVWSNGDTSESINNLFPGIYTATITDSNGCVYDTSISLNSYSTLSIEAVATHVPCDGSTTGTVQANVLTGNAPPFSYSWSNGDSAATTTVVPGMYTVTVVDSFNCFKVASTTVLAAGLTDSAIIVPVTCPDSSNGSISVMVFGGNPPYAYSWNTGATTDSISNIPVGTYLLVVSDEGDCSLMDTFLVQVDESGNYNCLNDTLIIYNVFSPNGDGINDFWVIEGLENYDDCEIQIFNRWGNKVWERKGDNNSLVWDGKNESGKDLPSATYYYILKLNDGKEKTYAGDITIVR